MQENFVVVLTGAAGNIGNTLVYLLGSQNIFGQNKRITLRLVDLPETHNRLTGLKMEIDDCLFDRIAKVEICEETKEAFQDADCVLMVAGKPRLIGMERRDLLDKNAALFKRLAALCNETTKPDAKFLIVANPCNTNALIFSEFAPRIPKKNITALSMLDQARAKVFISEELSVAPYRLKDVIVYGNHSSSLFVDISRATLLSEHESRGASQHLSDLLSEEFLSNELQQLVQARGGKIIQAKGSSASFSATQAIINHLKCWYLGSDGELVSMGVICKGVLDYKEELCISLPVICSKGEFEILPNMFEFNNEAHLSKIRKSIQSLVEEKMFVNELFGSN